MEFREKLDKNNPRFLPSWRFRSMRAEFHWYTADLVELGGLMFLFIDKIIKHLLSQELDKYISYKSLHMYHAFLAAVS